ncbi:radical SAM protein [Candidatus Poribacteria bacterium]|nr:radical SAM protein [Candidatus Poribacteria bacterium]
MANVVFIEPRCSFNSYGFFRLPLMGSLCLGTILKQAEHEVLVFRDSVKSVYNKAKDKLNENILKADVVAISVMTSTANRAYQIADAIRRASPRIRIIMGGAHATYMPEEALQHSDLVVKGEGEEIIIESVENHKLTGIIDGPSVDDLNKYPIPDFSILADMNKPPRVTPISTSRGCPYDCIFCTVSSTFGRKYRFRDPDLVLEEIRMRVADGFRTFFFYDDNFAANRPGTKKLLEGMADLGVDISWSAEARTNIARDKELLKLMARANCDRVFIGFESINPKTLESYNKRQTLDDVKKCINNLHEAGIGIHGMFALGSDDDDLNTIKDTVKFCHEMEMKSAQFALLHPLPGSRLYNILDSEDRIFTKDWSLYDGTHVVFKPNRIHPVELQEKFFWAWKTFYSLWHKPHLYLVCRYVIKKWKKKNKNRMVELKKKFNDVNWKPNFSNND